MKIETIEQAIVVIESFNPWHSDNTKTKIFHSSEIKHLERFNWTIENGWYIGELFHNDNEHIDGEWASISEKPSTEEWIIEFARKCKIKCFW